ncbi:MAG: hypothetical protein AAF560_01180 [Acidobacteriota bacterium]
MSKVSPPRWLVPVAGSLVFVALSAGAFYLYLSSKEREHYSTFETFLTAEATAEYQALSLLDRLSVAESTVGIVDELEKTSWSYSIEELRDSGDNSHQFAFALDLGPGSVRGCTFPSPSPTSGTCDRGGSLNATPWAPTQAIGGLFDVQLGSDPYVETRSTAPLALGSQGDYDVRARARVDKADVSLTDARVLVPNPISEGHQPIRIEDLALSSASFIRAREDYDFEISYPMPALLEPMYGNSKLTVVHLRGAIEADLRNGKAGFRAEGKLMVMNHEVGHAALEYFPGNHTSLWVPILSLPLPLPGVCFDVRDALFEYDFQEKRLRLGGGMEVETAHSLTCSSAAREKMGMVTRKFIVEGLEQIRSTFDIPQTIHTRGHIVVDFDDAILCGDATINGVSVLHAMVAGRDRDFYMSAPKQFRTKDFDGGYWDMLRLGKDMYSADWSFPDSTPWSCWSGDEGPRTDLFGTILPETVYQD